MNHRIFWIVWSLLNAGLIWGSYQVRFVDGLSFTVGALIMMLNIFVVMKIIQRLLYQNQDVAHTFLTLGGKFVIFILLIYFLPKVLPVELFSVSVGIFTVAISAACASVPMQFLANKE